MAGEALYERYKDALRRGHVASLQGRLGDALTAYGEAATIAPERATPHTSAGAALLRAKRPADALDQYAVALRLAPQEEVALLGRAETLTALDRRREAADTFDALADVRAGAGKLAAAVDAARRGLELAEGRERRRTLERLVAQLREAEPAEPGRDALDRALRVLDGPAAGSFLEWAATTRAAGDAVVGADTGAPGTAIAGRRAILDRELPAGMDMAALERAAEGAIDADQRDEATERLLDLAAAQLRDGCRDAAFDACYLALSFVPDHAALHLALVELYDERGWRSLAIDKLSLLERLVALDGDEAAIAEVAAARAARV
jgi:Tfp pilus assembly protein PilF